MWKVNWERRKQGWKAGGGMMRQRAQLGRRKTARVKAEAIERLYDQLETVEGHQEI